MRFLFNNLSRLQLKALLLIFLVLGDESARVVRAIEFERATEDHVERTRRYLTKFRGGKSVTKDEVGDVPHNAVLLALETETKVGTEAICYGVCTGIAIAIAIAAAVAAGVTVGIIVNAHSAMLKLEDVLKDIQSSKSSSCVIIRRIAFATKTFQVATRAFSNSIKIKITPPRSPSEDNVAKEFIAKLGLKGETDTGSTAKELQYYLDKMLGSLENHSEQVIQLMDRITKVSCSQYTSRYEKSLRIESHKQRLEVKKLWRQLIVDVITFVIASVGAGVGVAANVAVSSSTSVVLTTVNTIAKSSEAGFTVTEDLWSVVKPVSHLDF